MKRFMLVVLFTMPFCKAADPYHSWHQAARKYESEFEDVMDLSNSSITVIPADLSLPFLEKLDLSGNKIRKIPDELFLPWLQELNLSGNPIGYVDPNTIKKFSKLKLLNISNTNLSSENVKELQKAYPDLIIEEGMYLKPAKRGK